METPANTPEEKEEVRTIDPARTGNTVRASWAISLDNLRSNIAHCAPEGKELLVSSFLWCIDHKHPVTREEFATKVGYSANVIYKIMQGKYTHPQTGERLDIPEKLIKAMREFLRLEKARYEGAGIGFVETPTAKKIWTACDLARESQTPVFLIGPSHIGKTWAMEHYSANNNHGRSPYIRIKAASGLHGMIARIAEKVGVSPKGSAAALVDRIKRAVTPNMVLLIDEVHQLVYTYRRESFFSCLEVLREIYDETSCGLVLCGTQLFMEKSKGATNGELDQLLRRGVHRVQLPSMPTKADLTAILQEWGLEFPDRSLSCEYKGHSEQPYEMLRQTSKRDGLKAITERLRYGRKLAGRRKEDLSWDHVCEAHLRITAQTMETPDWT